MLQSPYIIFESQLGIISLKKQGLCFAFQAIPCCFSHNFMQFVQFHNESNVFIWVKKHFWSTLGREHSIGNRAYKGHRNKRRSFCFVLVIFSNLDSKFPHNVENQVANPLIFIRKIQNLCFASQTTHLRFSTSICIFSNAIMNIVSIFHQYMYLFQCDNKYSFLI